jgi:Uncharacterised nucleotidyltransferase
MIPPDATLRFVAAHGLPGDRPIPARITAAGADVLLQQAVAERLMGLLDQAVADGAVLCDDEAAELVAGQAVRTQAGTLLVERHHLVVHELLEEAGIEHRFLKGPSAAHRFYEHPALRPFSDVDVLVQGADLDRSVDVLHADGHDRTRPELTPGFSARFGKSVTMRSAARIEVDLHRVLASGPFGTVASPDALWTDPASEITLAGTGLPVLAVDGAFVHACVHLVTGTSPRLSSMRDVAQIAALLDQGTAGVAALAAELGVTACVARAAALTGATLAPSPAPTLVELGTWQITARERRWLDLYAHGASYAARARAGILATPGARAKVSAGWAMWRARRGQHR